MRTSCAVRAHTICPILIIIISAAAAAAAAITDDKSADEEVEDEKRTESLILTMLQDQDRWNAVAELAGHVMCVRTLRH